jgi:hypothetical protein
MKAVLLTILSDDWLIGIGLKPNRIRCENRELSWFGSIRISGADIAREPRNRSRALGGQWHAYSFQDIFLANRVTPRPNRRSLHRSIH